LGVIDIAIHPIHHLAEFIGVLPLGLKKRIVLIDEDLRSISKRNAILAPIAEEFNIELGTYFIKYRKTLPEDLSSAIADLSWHLRSFLLGLEHELQIDIDLQRTQKAISILRQVSRNPDSRANLAILSGIFETYRQMSVHVHSLGFPTRMRRSITIVGRLAKRLVTKAPFRQIVNLCSKGITTATHVPVPDSEMCASLIKKDYFPPIVSFQKAVYQAVEEAWISTKPDFVAPKGIQK